MRTWVAALLTAFPAAAAFLTPPPDGLSLHGYRALGLILSAVVGWSLNWADTAYLGLTLMLAFVVTGVASADVVFGVMGAPVLWLFPAAFLMSVAAERVGLARRLSARVLRGVRLRWWNVFPVALGLNVLLGLAVPVPFPRSLLIMSLFAPVARRLPPSQAAALGFAVFLGGVPGTMLTQTGDAGLNGAFLLLAGSSTTWIEWLVRLGVPVLVAAAGISVLLVRLFPCDVSVNLELDDSADRRPLSPDEWRVLAWLGLAVVFWVTNGWHGLHPAWGALAAVCGMALPGAGGVLTARDLGAEGNWPVFLFTGAALAIGRVSEVTGLSSWLAATVLPQGVPGGVYGFALAMTAVTMAVHMVMGSVMSVLAVLVPPVVAYARARGMDPLFAATVVYVAATLHFALPFQQLSILVGAGPAGGYGPRETLRFAPGLTLLTLFVGGVVLPWWWHAVRLA